MQLARLRAVTNVLGSWLGLGVTVLMGFFLTPFILHHVGDTAFGIWLLLTTFTGYYGLLDLGMRNAIIRYVARHTETGDHEALNRVASTTFFAYGVIAVALMAISVGVTLWFDRLFQVGPEWRDTGRQLLLLVGFGTALGMPLGMFGGVLEGLQRFSLVGVVQAVSTLLRALLIVVLLNRGHQILTLGLVTVGMNLVSSLLMAGIVFKLSPNLQIQWRYAGRATLATLGGFGLVTFWISIAQLLRFQFDNMVIGAFISVQAITYFSVGSRLVSYGTDVVQALAQVFTPMASAVDATGEDGRMRRIFLMGNRYSSFVALPLAALFLLCGGSVIRVWLGAQYEQYFPILAILTVPTTLYLMQAASPKVLYGMAKHKTLAVALLVEGIANLGLSSFLAPHYGIEGVAWGTAIPLALNSIFFLPIHLCRLLHVTAREFLFESFFYPVLAVIPFAATLWWMERWIHPLTYPALIAVLLPGGLVYGAALLLYYRFVEQRRAGPGGKNTLN